MNTLKSIVLTLFVVIAALSACNERNIENKNIQANIQKDTIPNCIHNINLLDKIGNYIDTVYVDEKYKKRLLYMVYFQINDNDTLVWIHPTFEIPMVINTESGEELDYFKGLFKYKEKVILVFDGLENERYSRQFYNPDCLTNDSSCNQYRLASGYNYGKLYNKFVKYKIINGQLILKEYVPN